MDENLNLKIENIIKEAMDDAELSAKLFKSKNVRKFYHILSANKDLKCSYDDFYDYFLYCKKLTSFFLSNEKPYSKKAIELVKIYGEICKNDKELDKFNSLKTTYDVLMYFNSLGSSSYSINDVIEFFRFRCSVIFKRLEISIERFRNAISENQKLVDESYLKCAGGIGNKERWISGVLGALSMMGSGFSGTNMASAHSLGYGGVVNDMINAREIDHSIEKTANIDYLDDEVSTQFSGDNNDDSDSSGFSFKGIASLLTGVVGAKAVKFIFDRVGLGEYAPKDLKGLMDLPDQLKKAEEAGKRLSNKLNKNGAIDKGRKISQLIRNSNDVLYNFLATYVKGQEKPLQEIVDLLICPFLTDIGEIANKKMKYYEKYGYYPDSVITPEEVRTYAGAVYGERGVGKTRCFNIAKKYIFDPAQIPAVYVAVGAYNSEPKGVTFEEFLSKQDCFVKAVNDLEYNKRFVFCFDEVDKLDDKPGDKKLSSFMEYFRGLSDKTQVTFREVGGDGKFTGRTSLIQCEAGLVFMLSNAVGPDETGAAAWRKACLTSDESILSRLFNIAFNPASDNIADSVTDTLIMEVQKNWYEANEINVEVDDTFTYNALAVLKYLGYNPVRDGVREIKNQIIPAMKTEFSRKYTKLLDKYNRLVAEGKDPRKIRFLFRWKKVDSSGRGTVLRGKGKLSPIVPVLTCRYIEDVNTLGVRIFNHRSDPGAVSTIWKPLYRADVDNFRDFMGRLESWKLWANQCRIEDVKQEINAAAKYKIRDVYRMLRFYMIGAVSSHYDRDTSAKYLMRQLKEWKKAARLTVSEKNLIFDGLSEMIEQWRVRAGDSDTTAGSREEDNAAERKREEEQRKQEEIERKKREEERKKREEEKKKQEEIERKKREEERKKQERAERKRLEKEEKERKKREKEEKKKREKEEKERKKREKEEKKKQENKEKKKQKNDDVPGGKVRPNAIEEENKKEDKKMPN